MAEQRPSQEPVTATPDPFEIWRQFYEANEQVWTKAIKDVTTTQAYVEAQGKMLEIFLTYQKMVRDAMGTQLTALNLPTRDDVANIGELVVGLEEKIDRLDEAIQQLAESIGAFGQRLATAEHRPPRVVESEGSAAAERPRRPGARPAADSAKQAD